jgi:hypothetical protein
MPLWDTLLRTCTRWLRKRPARQQEHSYAPSRPAKPLPLRIENLESRRLLSAGTGLTAQYYGDMNLSHLLMMRTDPTVDFNLAPGHPPAAGLPSTHYSVRWTGQVQAPNSGTYTFSTLSDDGIRVTVDGKTIINDWSDHSARQDNGSINLTGGQKYSIEVDYYQDGGSAVAELMWSGPKTPKEIVPTADLFPATPVGAGTGLIARYYKNTNLSGPAAVTQIASQIDFSSPTGQAPVSGLPASWSASYSGTIQPQYTGTYTFNTAADDGIRVFVNGKEVIDDWSGHGATSGSISLTAGQQYSLEVDYFHAAGHAAGIAIDAGGGAAGSFVGDTDFSGGKTYHTGAAINTSGVSNPAPQSVYQTQRYGNFTYTIPNLRPGATYTVRLDMAEIYWNAAGKRLFDVAINGRTVLTNFDIFAVAGGQDKAIAEQFTATADAAGRITVTFITLRDNAEINGIEVSPAMGGAATAKLFWSGPATPKQLVPKSALYPTPVSGDSPPPSNPPPSNPSPSNWFTQNLRDSALASLASTLYNSSGGQLTYDAMMSIFGTVVRAGSITSTELADLRMLVANGAALGMPASVQDLASKVLNANPANATYQGQPLGNLTVGSTATHLQDLVNKWFLGLDTPAGAAGVTYAYASGSLFGSGGPIYTNIVQGDVGDCYFLAALAEEAIHSPGAIQSMFTNNGNGTYTIRFYHNGVADYVTVDSDLPSSGGTFFYANAGAALNSSGNVLWVALAEKAYAQLAQEGWSRPTSVNAYSAIDQGWEGDAVNALTGRSETSQLLTNDIATLGSIVGAFNAGGWLAFDSNSSTAPGIVANHVYVMLGYNSSAHVFSLYNPWGYVQQVTWDQLAANFSYWSRNTT